MRRLWSRLCSSGSQVAKVGIRKPWRDSASLIIAAPNFHPGNDDSNYHILFLKRAAKSSFFPNAFVFPGGAIDAADKSPRWIELFRNVDSSFDRKVPEEFFVQQNDGKRPPLFPGDESALERGILPNEVAFRICAIRESFEESGVLLLTNNLDIRRRNRDAICAKSVTNLLSVDAVQEWRSKVHNDATEFLNLCMELQHVPDIWSLKEWSEWLTPIIGAVGKKNPTRYDAVFYSCCLQETPQDASHDEVETSASCWRSPKEMLQIFFAKKAFLAPPQLFELSRLLNFRTLDNLREYMDGRALMGLRRWMPFFCETKCGKRMEVFPGDDLYPDDLDEVKGQKGLKVIEKTMEEVMTTSENVFAVSLPDFVARCNIVLEYGQVAPANLRDVYPNTVPSAKL